MSDRAQNIHRSLPHSADAEQGVLGSALIGSRDVVEDIFTRMRPEHFHVPAHATVFRFAQEMHRESVLIDGIALTQRLMDAKELDGVGGVAFVTQLFTLLPTAANAGHYMAIVREKHILRSIIERGTRLAARCYDEQDQVKEIMSEAQDAFLDLALEGEAEESLRHIKAACANAMDRYDARYHNRGKLHGLPTGFVDLDRMTDGLTGGNIYVLAGRPATGKSSLGMAVASHVAHASIESGAGVAVFSCEMSEEQFIDRLVSMRCKIEAEKLRRGFFGQHDLDAMTTEFNHLVREKLWLDTTSGLTIDQFAANARKAVLKHGCRLIIIDHIQHMRGVDKRSRDNRALELKEVMEGVASTAKKLNVPIIVLAQLNREADERPMGKPTIADLKESGAIEEYAYLVGLLWRPIRWAKNDQQRDKLCEQLKVEDSDLENYAALIIDKHRNGPVGDVRLKFIGPLTRYEDADDAKGRPLYSNNDAHRQHYE